MQGAYVIFSGSFFYFYFGKLTFFSFLNFSSLIVTNSLSQSFLLPLYL